jgi:hypothetical protein
VARQNNYDKLLAMFNDAMQGRVSHLGTLIGGTPQFLEDPRRGLYSDPAWQRRTAQSRFAMQTGMTDTIAPVLRLDPLSERDMLTLLQRLSDVHRNHYDSKRGVNHQELKAFMQAIQSRAGADTLLTPGDIVRDFMTVLNLLHQNPKLTMTELVRSQNFQPVAPTKVSQVESDSEFAEFSV